MKIGILTYHRVINYGAFMQAYSLMKKIQQTYPNVEVEIIDYNSSKHRKKYAKILKDAIVRADVEKVKQFCLFYQVQKKFKLSKKIKGLSTKEIEKKISNMQYDIIVVGSDEVWKGEDEVFWLKSIKTAKKVSYAASSRIIFSEIPKAQRDYICSALEEFLYIGVRDAISKQELGKNLYKKINLNCDPAFLCDFKYDKEEFRKIVV